MLIYTSILTGSMPSFILSDLHNIFLSQAVLSYHHYIMKEIKLKKLEVLVHDHRIKWQN